eukprot:CAMPEP_0171827154 /NCGR_PEP_ID=MMETSP0992-20121227/6482_1 /TAXON_ID=483369 /ORGANISM="non described non described, Strain CCMP2098" /LENGTH=65 /DNA_ID=CAMNT_0012442259 /DNA_START=283 /DNA_END=480 /DNA_ORIENTATION=-
MPPALAYARRGTKHNGCCPPPAAACVVAIVVGDPLAIDDQGRVWGHGLPQVAQHPHGVRRVVEHA